MRSDPAASLSLFDPRIIVSEDTEPDRAGDAESEGCKEIHGWTAIPEERACESS